MPGLVASDRVLYVDSDIVVMRDVSRLAALPWQENHVVYAADDARITTVSAPWERIPWEALGIPGDTPYFNAGFLWVNLAEWRRQEVSRACHEYARRFMDRIAMWDQSILNAVLWQRRASLDKSWNQASEDAMDRLALYPLAGTRDANVHYVGRAKPWLEAHPFDHFYRAYAAEIAALVPAEFPSGAGSQASCAGGWRYFARRAFWNYGGSCKRTLMKLAGRQRRAG